MGRKSMVTFLEADRRGPSGGRAKEVDGTPTSAITAFNSGH